MTNKLYSPSTRMNVHEQMDNYAKVACHPCKAYLKRDGMLEVEHVNPLGTKWSWASDRSA